MNRKEILDFCGGFICCLLWLVFTYYFLIIFG